MSFLETAQKIEAQINNENYTEAITMIFNHIKIKQNNETEDEIIISNNSILKLFNEFQNEEMNGLYACLSEVFLIVNDPRILYPILKFHVTKQTKFAFYSIRGIYQLILNYNLNYDDFYSDFFEIIDIELIERHMRQLFSFLKFIFSNQFFPLKGKMAYIKKLARLALNCKNETSYNILSFIFLLMKLNPITFKMVQKFSFKTDIDDLPLSYDSFQPYLFEFDILFEGLPHIKNVINDIRMESTKKTHKYDRNILIQVDTVQKF